jgi:hypothetical protein
VTVTAPGDALAVTKQAAYMPPSKTGSIQMPKFLLIFNAPATVAARKRIEADSLDDAQRIAREMLDAGKPSDDEFAYPEIADRRDITITVVG